MQSSYTSDSLRSWHHITVLVRASYAHYVVQCCEQVRPEFGITVMEEAEQEEILDFCIPLIHFMIENTFTITGVADNCTVPNTQFNVQIGLRNQVITRHQPLCAVDHPDISILNGKYTNSVNTNNTHINLITHLIT